MCPEQSEQRNIDQSEKWSPLLKGDIGKIAAMTALLLGGNNEQQLIDAVRKKGYLIVTGHVGAMESQKVVGAIESAAKRSALVDSDLYREQHALYHALMEALSGISRGQISFGGVLRTVGLRYTVVRGLKSPAARAEGEWIAVALYGTIGAPIKGAEHEVLGLGINHI
ncbi:HutP family protein [Numidum massiliense]|uniref:HutP family protein n=1 Tax=Numidum massiliense TaxID=1522315 RepID=UPI000939A134|nr:HutP family protein [Numidum massiliense]